MMGGVIISLAFMGLVAYLVTLFVNRNKRKAWEAFQHEDRRQAARYPDEPFQTKKEQK